MERIPQLLAYLEKSPSDAFVNFALALEYIKSGDKETGKRYFEHLVEIHPDYVGTYYHLAKLYISMQMPEAAEKCYASGIEVAKKLQDQHALAELQNAALNFRLGLTDED
jgi:Tfp pilus assembly protein PilF